MGVIGQPIDRRDGRLKVTGTALYAAEFHPPGMVYAALVQSTIASGEIADIDTAAARSLPGVLVVVTPDNALRLKPAANVRQAVAGPMLQDRAVRYHGSHVAVVVADTQQRASDAASAVRVRYVAAPARTMLADGLSDQVLPKKFRNGQRAPDTGRGDAAAAFAGAPVKLDVQYTTPVEHHNPMELHATIAAWDGDDRLTVWHTTQGVVGTRDTLAAMFDLKPENVVVIDPYVGGGFGSKGNAWPPLVPAAMAAKIVGRPVRLELTRAQMFTSNGYRPATIQRLRLGAAPDGGLLSLRHDGINQNSDPVLGEFAEPTGSASEMLYAVEDLAVTHRLVSVNQGLPTYMRAPGEASGMFALESAMDELAGLLRMDPLALRLRNHADIDGSEGKPFSAKKLREAYAQGAEAFGWQRRDAAPRSMRDGRWLVGWGMATATYPMNRMKATARVRLFGDGTALVQAASQDIGTGTYTILAQIAAEALDLPVSRVRVQLGDSRLPEAPVSGGSLTAASVGPAVLAAARQVRAKLLQMAAVRWPGTSASDLRLVGGAVVGAQGRATLGQILAGADSVDADATAEPGDARKTHSLHSFGAQFCEVRVDADTGEVRVARWVGVFDAGRILNAKTARSQAIGGITFGIGMALLEGTRIDRASGGYTNRSLAEYLVPVNADIPDLQVSFVANDDQGSNPLGARGLGELPMVGAAAAVANAVYHATGTRVRDLPIRPEQLLA